jgi:hypothetical protein
MMPSNSVFRTDPFFTGDSNMTAELDRVDSYMKDYWHPYDGTPRSPMMPVYSPPLNNANDRLVRYNYELDQIPLGRRHSHGDIFHQMRNVFDDAHRTSLETPKVHSYKSSKVMTYTSDGVNEPKKYEAFSETSQAPGGIKQTFKREKNSVTGKDRMQAGRYIYDRGHVVEKTEDLRDHDVRVNHDYLNMDQQESDGFHNEWSQKVPKNGKLVFTRNDGWVPPRRLLKWQHPFSKNYDGSEYNEEEKSGRRRSVSFKY